MVAKLSGIMSFDGLIRNFLHQSWTTGIIMATIGVLLRNALMPATGRHRRMVASRTFRGRPSIREAIQSMPPVSFRPATTMKRTPTVSMPVLLKPAKASDGVRTPIFQAPSLPGTGITSSEVSAATMIRSAAIRVVPMSVSTPSSTSRTSPISMVMSRVVRGRESSRTNPGYRRGDRGVFMGLPRNDDSRPQAPIQRTNRATRACRRASASATRAAGSRPSTMDFARASRIAS